MLKTIDRNQLVHVTKANRFYIESLTTFIDVKDVLVEYEKLALLCEEGCKNFNTKYCCPPISPSFQKVSRGFKYLTVNVFKTRLKEYKTIYNTIRMINNVNKTIQRRIIDQATIEGEIILENGSCRLCRNCQMENNLPCKYPGRMRYSLEATGIHVYDLVMKCFDFPLLWYSKGNFPEYQCVVSGILTNNPDDATYHIIKAFEGYKQLKGIPEVFFEN